jgi:alanine racemase
MSKFRETVLEIDLNALSHNFEYIKSQLNPKTKILAVIKAFAYGTDVNEISNHLEKLKVDYFAVAYTNEGVALRKAGITTPILVLHPQPANFYSLIDNCLEPSLYSKRGLDLFIDLAKQKSLLEYPIHLKFNTGLNRLGFRENDIHLITDKILATNHVKVVSLFSHLAASEDKSEKNFTLSQINTFEKISKVFIKKIDYKPLLHLLNTSGVLNYPQAQFDMVRCGIGLYGFGNDPKLTKHLKLVASLKSVISQIHLIEPNETVGYNRAFKSEKLTKIATIPIGHADGISRAFGNGKGYVLIHNNKAPVIGNVCMDMLMVDVTDIVCEEGDEVIVFNNQQTINDLAERINTISYELMTAISQRVKRIVK